MQNKLLSLKKAGYIDSIPKDANLDEYEMISLKISNQKQKTLYRYIRENKKEDISDFNTSWDVFNSLLDV